MKGLYFRLARCKFGLCVYSAFGMTHRYIYTARSCRTLAIRVNVLEFRQPPIIINMAFNHQTPLIVFLREAAPGIFVYHRYIQRIIGRVFESGRVGFPACRPWALIISCDGTGRYDASAGLRRIGRVPETREGTYEGFSSRFQSSSSHMLPKSVAPWQCLEGYCTPIHASCC